jgi:hypothetical protein
LTSQFVQIPHDVVVPGLLQRADLPDLAAALAPRPVQISQLVDGLHRRQSVRATQEIHQPVADACRAARAPEQFSIADDSDVSTWLLEQLVR